jgi:hypothetical protein
MRKFAMRTVDLGPLLEQRHDLGLFLGPQAVDGVAADRAIDQTIGGPTGAPPPGAGLGQLQAAADAGGGPSRP